LRSSDARAEPYAELPPRPELRRHVACVWFERTHADGKPVRTRVLPDGYVDLVFGRSLWVRGPDTHAHAVSYGGDRSFVGIRFRPGAAPAVLGVPATELVDGRLFLRDLWGAGAEELEDRLHAAPPSGAAAVLEEALLARLAPPDPLVEQLVSLLRDGRDVSRIRAVADELGTSERQLLRRSLRSLGYGPKMLQRIMRLQRFLRLAETRRSALAQLAGLAGYADQPHLTRECRRLTGDAPSAFLA
jgi:AraC-like DNA-binding protein